MVLAERFVDNHGVRIRYLDSDPQGATGLPVVFVPGMVDVADDYLESFGSFSDRRVVVVEMRGRGGSDSPPDGYAVSDQAGDVGSVIRACGFGSFHLMTFSRGTTPALELAMQSPERVRSVSIGDYLPAEIGLTGDFAENMFGSKWRGRRASSRVTRQALQGIQRASRSRELWAELAAFDVPVLVARPTEGGIVDDEREARYRDSVPGVEVVTIPGAGHDIFRYTRTAYPDAVLAFIASRCPGT